MIEAEKKLWEAFVNLYSEASALRNNTTLPASFLEALDTVETCERQLRSFARAFRRLARGGDGRLTPSRGGQRSHLASCRSDSRLRRGGPRRPDVAAPY